MIGRITNLVKQMSKSEQQALTDHIKNKYCLEEKKGMLRDDISLKVRELLETNHTWLTNLQEENTLEELELYATDMTAFADALLVEFNLEQVEFSAIMEWTTVKDIVDYMEDALENKGASNE